METRHKVEKEDYCLQGNPDANVEENTTVDPSRMDILRVYSTYETNPHNGDYNYFEYQAGRFNARTTLKLKPDSAIRLKSQIVDSLIQLAQHSHTAEAEDDTLDWSSSEFVMGDFEERQIVWIERDPEKDGEFEIKRKSYIKHSSKQYRGTDFILLTNMSAFVWEGLKGTLGEEYHDAISLFLGKDFLRSCRPQQQP